MANNLEALVLLALLGAALPGLWRDAGLWRTVTISALASAALWAMLGAARALSAPLLPALMADHAYAWRAELLPLLLWLAIAAALGSGLYLALTAALGVDPARALLSRLRRARAAR